MRLGVLDIGSNSAQLQMVDVAPGAPPLPAHAVKKPTLLGEAILPDGSLSQDGIERVGDAVAEAMATAARCQVDQLYPFVTAAVRDATNREEVIDHIERVAGVRPQFLSGEQETRLTYLAVHRWFGWSAGRLVVIDIGGGSMELVLGRDAEPELAISLPLGAGALTRRFLADDPPTGKQMKDLRKYVRSTLREVSDRFRWEGDPRRAVATSKTFKQLARLAGAPPQRKGPFVERILDRRDLHAWVPKLAALTTAERARLRGISESRARQVLAAAMVADATMETLDVRKVRLCPLALREGIMLRHLESIADAPDLPLQPLVHHHHGAAATVTPLTTPRSGAPTRGVEGS